MTVVNYKHSEYTITIHGSIMILKIKVREIRVSATSNISDSGMDHQWMLRPLGEMEVIHAVSKNHTATIY